MHTISLNTFTYLLIILPKSLTKASEELWPAPHRCSPTVVITFSCFRSSIRESHRRTTVLILHIISWRRLWERVANSHFVSLPEKLKTIDSNNLSLMEAGDASAQPLSASERQMQALTANIQELARQSAADRREMQELAKQNQELMALLRSRGEIPSSGQSQNGEEIPRNEARRNQNQNQNQNDEGSSANQNRVPHPSQVADPTKSAANARAAKLEQELKEMREQMKEIKSQVKAKAARNLDMLVHRSESPFTERVDEYPLPAKFKVPQLETFDGFKDSLDYLDSFRTVMRLQGVSNEIMCRTFPTNLRGSARTWFNQLETGSIDTFAQLSRAFIDNFIGGRRSARPANYLLNIRQREGESLRSYVQQFNKEVVQIDEPNEYVALTAFNAGLHKGDFLFQLCKDPPKSMSELMYEAKSS